MNRFRLLSLLVVALPLPSLEGQGDSPNRGLWYPAYNWNLAPGPVLNLIHVGLIPTGPQKGKVVFLTWDTPARWGILDPDLQQPNQPPPPGAFTLGPAPTGITNFQEATCVGQSWTPDGRWFVAGGQIGPTGGVGQGFGSYGAWIYDPDVVGLGAPTGPPNFYEYGQWFQEPLMQNRRYYPTVMLTQTQPPGLLPNGGELIVAGGSDDFFLPYQTPTLYHNNYETFRPGQRNWGVNYLGGTWQTTNGQPTGPRLFPGPTGTGKRFLWYPRLFLLPEGRMVNAATEPQSSIAAHPTTSSASWINLGARTIAGSRGYGTAVLYPNLSAAYENTTVNMGGTFWVGGVPFPTTNVEWANAASSQASSWPNGYLWTASPTPTSLPPLLLAREECNSVLLPNGMILLLHDGSPQQHKTPELLNGGTWQLMAPESSVRDHHATALLLRSGRVLSSSGNSRSVDFQVYEPPYLSGPRPAWGAVPGNGVLLRGQNYSVPITLPAGTAVGKVVLMRPGSLTHHADMDQRYIQLPLIGEGVAVAQFKAPYGPPGSTPTPGLPSAPLGYYMIFLVTNTGVPSVAHFVQFL